eukprot:m.331745 g.331745  ORF g.331745 m.331745 type:complete len:161 (+) comp16056_c0_seq2:952-1434(+)
MQIRHTHTSHCMHFLPTLAHHTLVHSHPNPTCFLLYSQREGLAPFMMGALKGLAALLFDLDVDITHRSKKGMKGATHDVFRVFLDDVYVSIPPPSHQSRDHSDQSPIVNMMPALPPWLTFACFLLNDICMCFILTSSTGNACTRKKISPLTTCRHPCQRT